VLFLVYSCIPTRQWTDICNTRCSILSRFSHFHVSHFQRARLFTGVDFENRNLSLSYFLFFSELLKGELLFDKLLSSVFETLLCSLLVGDFGDELS